jgi:holo-[acyl-carrier protein] synthase
VICGLGLDLVKVSRIERALARFGNRFLARCFTTAEAADALEGPHPAQALARRFAAKEAFAKATGLGLGGLVMIEIEVAHEPPGRPFLVLHGRAWAWAQNYNVASCHLTLTDDGDYAAAVIVLER